MARTDHGLDLSTGLVLQPGSRFKRTRSGFDTGTRIYKCDRSVTELLAPRVGDSDLILAGGRHARMFVDDVDIAEGTNEIDTLTIAFLGLIGAGGKGAIISGSTNTNQFMVGQFVVSDTTPSISVAYVQEDAPDPWEAGQPSEPPIGQLPEEGYRPHYFTSAVSYPPPVYQGWVLNGRTFRQAGPLWEVTDTFEYLIIQAAAS